MPICSLDCAHKSSGLPSVLSFMCVSKRATGSEVTLHIVFSEVIDSERRCNLIKIKLVPEDMKI